MGSWVSSIIATLDKRTLLTYLREMREQSRNRDEITTLNAILSKVEAGDFDG